MNNQRKNKPNAWIGEDRTPCEMKNAYSGARRVVPRLGRNDKCPCKSGLKFKKCCVDWRTFAGKLKAKKEAEEKSKEEALAAKKGVKGGNCNRRDCQKPGAVWYNHSTEKYYCEDCAIDLNEFNRKDSLEIFGHDLCTLDEGDGITQRRRDAEENSGSNVQDVDPQGAAEHPGEEQGGEV